MREMGAENGIRRWGKCIIEFRIEFPDPMLMTFDTPHEPNTKFLKKMSEKCRKNYFSPTLVFD